MTVEAPPHRQVLHLAHAFHRFDRTVALAARHAGDDMPRMIERGVIRQAMDAHPIDRRRRRAGARFLVAIEPERSVELHDFGRDRHLDRSTLGRGSRLGGAHIGDPIGDEAVAVHAGGRARDAGVTRPLRGGVTGICAGATLEQLTGWSYSLGGWVVNGFHILFGISIAFRLGGVVLAYRIHDPGATDWSTLIEYLIWGTVRDTKLAIRLGLLAQELAPEQDTSPASIMLHRSPIVDLVRPTAAAATAKPVVPSPKPIEAATPVPPPHVPIPVRIDGPSTGAPSAPLTVSRASPE